jgi:hypothetical protein
MQSRWQLCILVIVAACSDATQSATMEVGPAGGQVSAGAASVSIPAGTLTSTVSITVTSTSAPAPADATTVGTPYLFGPEGTQFAQPVTVTLAFSSGLLPAGTTGSDVVIYTAPLGGTSYTALPTTLADASHVQAPTTHFSVFVAAVHGKRHDMAMSETDLASGAVDAGVDLSVADAGADLSVADAALDLGNVFNPSGDLSAVDAGADLAGGVADLAQAADLLTVDDAGCALTFTRGNGTCTVSATCAGHNFQVQCQVNACGCYVDGASNFAINAINACASSPQTLWTSCLFP